MSAPATRWEPAADPVHGLIARLDFQAAMTACHRWRPIDPEPDAPPDDSLADDCRPPPPDPEAHPTAILHCEVTAAQADEAIAEYVRLGQPDAARVVRGIAGLLMEVGDAYRVRACPCHLCPDCGGRPFAAEVELAFSVVYRDSRQTLLHHLALAGQAVPRAVRMRGADLAQLLRADDPPDAHAVLRRLVGEAVTALAAGNPAGLGPEAVAGWVDKLAGPAGAAVRPTWRVERERPVSPEEYAARVERQAATRGDDLPPARRAILAALAAAGEPLPGKKLAARAGYKPGSLRRHTRPLQDAGLVRWTAAGFELTPAGVTAAAAHAPVTYAVTPSPS